jgi:hypothetical protein
MPPAWLISPQESRRAPDVADLLPLGDLHTFPMNERLHATYRDFFSPRDLLLTTICLHVVGVLLTAGWFVIPLVAFAYSQPIHYLPFILFVAASLALLVFSWRSRRWFPSIIFCVGTLSFWGYAVFRNL